MITKVTNVVSSREDGTIVDADVTCANIALSKVAGLSNVTQPTIGYHVFHVVTRAMYITVSYCGYKGMG